MHRKKLALLITCVLLAGCGGDEQTTTTTTNPDVINGRGTHIGSALACSGGPNKKTECKEER